MQQPPVRQEAAAGGQPGAHVQRTQLLSQGSSNLSGVLQSAVAVGEAQQGGGGPQPMVAEGTWGGPGGAGVSAAGQEGQPQQEEEDAALMAELMQVMDG